MDRQTGLLNLFIIIIILFNAIIYSFVCLPVEFPLRSPGLVNFGVLDELPNLPKYRGIKTPTVEIIGDLAHV